MFATGIATLARTKRIVISTPSLTTYVVSRNIVSGPPRVRVSFAEKLVHGAVMSVAVLIVPFYVLANIKNYKGASN